MSTLELKTQMDWLNPYHGVHRITEDTLRGLKRVKEIMQKFMLLGMSESVPK